MFNSTVLEVAIGLVFCFASVSLMVSSFNEAIASLVSLRASTLLSGIQSLLNDPKFNGLALALYNHALVNPSSNGAATDKKTLSSSPSYIDANHFALALIDILQKAPGDFASLGATIDKIEDKQLRQLLQGMYARSSDEVDKFQAQLASWFNNAMDRVSGLYKRRIQLISFLLGLAIAAAFNIDAIHLFDTLWLHPGYVAQLSIPANPQIASVVAGLQQLPIGWPAPPQTSDADLFLRVAGWLVTASSVLLGSAFWFDLLQRLLPLRSNAAKPNSQAA